MILAADMLGIWAILFSSYVRIQTDRGQTVVSAGPYRVVRHRGYAGAILAWIAGLVFFSSYRVAIPSVEMIVLKPTYKGNRR